MEGNNLACRKKEYSERTSVGPKKEQDKYNNVTPSYYYTSDIPTTSLVPIGSIREYANKNNKT